MAQYYTLFNFNSPTILYSSSQMVIQCEYLQAIGSDSTEAAGKMPRYPMCNRGKTNILPQYCFATASNIISNQVHMIMIINPWQFASYFLHRISYNFIILTPLAYTK